MSQSLQGVSHASLGALPSTPSLTVPMPGLTITSRPWAPLNKEEVVLGEPWHSLDVRLGSSSEPWQWVVSGEPVWTAHLRERKREWETEAARPGGGGGARGGGGETDPTQHFQWFPASACSKALAFLQTHRQPGATSLPATSLPDRLPRYALPCPAYPLPPGHAPRSSPTPVCVQGRPSRSTGKQLTLSFSHSAGG